MKGTIGIATIFLMLLGAGIACDGGQGTGTAPEKNSDPVAKTDSTPASAPADKAASAPFKPADGKAGVYFIWPEEGSKVFEASNAIFGVTGKEIGLAGEEINNTLKGHHHIIIDGKPIPAGEVIPANSTHVHFGKGETETELILQPGKHTLTLQFGDGAHRSYGPDMSKTINIEVVSPKTVRRVFFVEPKDKAKVKSPFKVKFGIEGMTLQPAGEAPADKTSGHHHIIINGKPLPLAKVVPADEKHIHFGKGQTETDLTLPPGKHTLTLQLADGAHRSYGPDLSQTITVEVEK